MSKYRSYSLRKMTKKARLHYYRQKALIKRVWYLYPDDQWRFEIEPCVWNKGTPHEREGWPACTAQLVCPFISNENYDSEGKKRIEALGRCHQDCRDPMKREAIEAWITLYPDIM